MSKVAFNELKFTGLGRCKGLVRDLQSVKIGKWDNTRIYYFRDEHHEQVNGFDFIVLEFMQCTGGSDNWWEDINSELEVEVVMTGEACFDGIRHITSGDVDNKGYMYYPDSANMIEIWTELRKLETQFCMEGEF